MNYKLRVPDSETERLTMHVGDPFTDASSFTSGLGLLGGLLKFFIFKQAVGEKARIETVGQAVQFQLNFADAA